MYTVLPSVISNSTSDVIGMLKLAREYHEDVASHIKVSTAMRDQIISKLTKLEELELEQLERNEHE